MDWCLLPTPAPTRASTILPLLKSCTFSIRRGTGAGAAIRRQSGHHPERDKPAQRAHPYQQEPNLMQVTSLYDAAMLIGKTLLEVIQRDSSNQQNCSNTNFNCNLLLGGQIAGETHRLFHIYPEGNFIEATATRLISRLAKANTASRSSIGC
jgi:hypothetical protein